MRESLRRQIQEANPALGGVAQGFGPLSAAGALGYSPDLGEPTARPKLIHLILDERNERTHNHSGLALSGNKSGKLKHNRLS